MTSFCRLFFYYFRIFIILGLMGFLGLVLKLVLWLVLFHDEICYTKDVMAVWQLETSAEPLILMVARKRNPIYYET